MKSPEDLGQNKIFYVNNPQGNDFCGVYDYSGQEKFRLKFLVSSWGNNYRTLQNTKNNSKSDIQIVKNLVKDSIFNKKFKIDDIGITKRLLKFQKSLLPKQKNTPFRELANWNRYVLFNILYQRVSAPFKLS